MTVAHFVAFLIGACFGAFLVLLFFGAWWLDTHFIEDEQDEVHP